MVYYRQCLSDVLCAKCWFPHPEVLQGLVSPHILGHLWIRDGKFADHLATYSITDAFQQFLLAAGLQYEKSSRATNMIYLQMFFALAFDKLVWGTTPDALSIIGSLLILGSAIYVAMNKEEPKKKVEPRERAYGEEERGLMSPGFDSERIEGDDLAIPMRPLR
jgi:hypothetical protein